MSRDVLNSQVNKHSFVDVFQKSTLYSIKWHYTHYAPIHARNPTSFYLLYLIYINIYFQSYVLLVDLLASHSLSQPPKGGWWLGQDNWMSWLCWCSFLVKLKWFSFIKLSKNANGSTLHTSGRPVVSTTSEIKIMFLTMSHHNLLWTLKIGLKLDTTIQ